MTRPFLYKSPRSVRWATLLVLLVYIVCAGRASVYAVDDYGPYVEPDPSQNSQYEQGINFYEVNPIGGSDCSGTSGSSGTAQASGPVSANATTVFKYLVTTGNLSKVAAAGLVGNFMQESGATVSPTADNGVGYKGIAQWSGGRWANLVKFAGDKDPNSLEVQEAYVVYELNNSYKSTVLVPLEGTTTAQQAAQIVFTSYEIAGDSSLPTRQANAQLVYNQLSSAVAGPDTGGGTADVTAGSCADSTTVDTSTLYQDSTGVPCPANTKDIGTADGYHSGAKIEIRLCAVSNLPSSSEESHGGYGISGTDGDCILNSRVAGVVYNMVAAAKNNGVTLTASSCFRTMAHQQALCAANAACSSGDNTRVAAPGTSNHQMGLAVDFAGLPATPGPIPGNPYWDWLSANAAKYGYKNYPAEAWHWSPTGN